MTTFDDSGLEAYLERLGENERMETVKLIGCDLPNTWGSEHGAVNFDLLSIDFSRVDLNQTWAKNKELRAERERATQIEDKPSPQVYSLREALKMVTEALLHDFYVTSRIASSELSADEQAEIILKIKVAVPLLFECDNTKLELATKLVKPLGKGRSPMWPPKAVARFVLDVCQLIKDGKDDESSGIFAAPDVWVKTYLKALDTGIGYPIMEYSDQFRRRFEGEIYQDSSFTGDFLRAVRLIFALGQSTNVEDSNFKLQTEIVDGLEAFDGHSEAVANAICNEICRLCQDGSIDGKLVKAGITENDDAASHRAQPATPPAPLQQATSLAPTLGANGFPSSAPPGAPLPPTSTSGLTRTPTPFLSTPALAPTLSGAAAASARSAQATFPPTPSPTPTPPSTVQPLPVLPQGAGLATSASGFGLQSPAQSSNSTDSSCAPPAFDWRASASSFGLPVSTNSTQSKTSASKQPRVDKFPPMIKGVGKGPGSRPFKLWSIPVHHEITYMTVHEFIKGLPDPGDICAQPGYQPGKSNPHPQQAVLKFCDHLGWIDVTQSFNENSGTTALQHPAYPLNSNESRVLCWKNPGDSEPSYVKWRTYADKFGHPIRTWKKMEDGSSAM